tara:strand:+ start:11635 stop:12930 length:1296 start_codon:yes stop_codon:yes gene_type:complete
MSNSASVKKLTEHLENKTSNSRNTSFTKALKKAVFKHLSHLQYGQLTLTDNGETQTFVGNKRSDLVVEMNVLNSEFYWYIALGGSVGAAEAYISDYWRTPDLTKVIQLFALNQSVMDSMESGLASFTTPIKKAFHWLNKNTHAGSKSNIVAHYDLGNDFFKLFLDPTMMYSSGIFYRPDDTMEQASINKLERICTRLNLKPEDHVIEIGTGWGGFAMYAAKNYGCHVTTTTISEEQYAHTQEQVEDAGLSDKITLLKHDYRELSGQYDKLVSIEMIEAVGHQYFDTFFAKCSGLLKDDGEMLIQAITISDQRFNSAKTEVDFIKRYIFPGSCIPSVNAISHSLTQSGDLRITNMDDIGTHYARTLNEWKRSFKERIEEVKALGFSDAFIRMWEYYFSYCEGGFKEQVISVSQLHLVKPLARVPMSLTPLEK